MPSLSIPSPVGQLTIDELDDADRRDPLGR